METDKQTGDTFGFAHQYQNAQNVCTKRAGIGSGAASANDELFGERF